MPTLMLERERRLLHTLTQFIAYLSDKEINVTLYRTLCVALHHTVFYFVHRRRSLGPSVADPTSNEQDQYNKSLIRSFVSVDLLLCYSATGNNPNPNPKILTLKPKNHNLNLNPTPYLLLSALHNHPFIAGWLHLPPELSLVLQVLLLIPGTCHSSKI